MRLNMIGGNICVREKETFTRSREKCDFFANRRRRDEKTATSATENAGKICGINFSCQQDKTILSHFVRVQGGDQITNTVYYTGRTMYLQIELPAAAAASTPSIGLLYLDATANSSFMQTLRLSSYKSFPTH